MKRILSIWLITSCGFLAAQPLNTARLDSLFDRLASNDKAMGSLVLSKNGSVIYSKAIGFRARTDQGAVASDVRTKYRIGSITKTFTAAMIFQLVEEGKLTLATTLDKYFPQFPNATRITVAHLLSHRSGLFNFTSDPTYPSWMTQPKTEVEMVTLASKYPVDFQPDEKFAYSNTNYLLLGYILEKVTGKTYATNLNDRITSRIGMRDTNYGGKVDTKRNEAQSFQFRSKWEESPETDMSIPGGAGALVSTPADLAKFIEALFELKVVSAASLDQMKTMRDNMGMGLFQVPFNNKRGFGHNGMIDGSMSVVFYFPEDALTIAYCSNGFVYPVNDILIGALSIYFDAPYKLPDFNIQPLLALNDEELSKYTGVYGSTQLPLKITITKDQTTLLAQATGQSSFPLSPTERDKFKFEPAGIVIEFTTKDQFTMKQGGGVFVFTRE
jgi:D-alanyl-D-alanine carboxypeptidase